MENQLIGGASFMRLALGWFEYLMALVGWRRKPATLLALLVRKQLVVRQMRALGKELLRVLKDIAAAKQPPKTQPQPAPRHRIFDAFPSPLDMDD